MWKHKGSCFSIDVFFPLLYNVYTSSQGFRLTPLICFLSVLPTFLVDKTVYYPSFFVSALCYCEPPLCLGPPLSLDVHCCFALWIRASSLWIYLLFPRLAPVLWPLPALTPPKPTFLFSKVFLLTPTPLLPGVYVQFFFHLFFFS